MVAGKKIIVIIDITGSMGELINWENESTKITFSKKIINEIVECYLFSIVEVMHFLYIPKPFVSFNDIPEPGGCTYFTPILTKVTKHIKTGSEYSSVIFMSDGIPSEPAKTGQKAITTLGSYCR